MLVAKDFYLLRTPTLPLNFLDQFNGLSHAQLKDQLKIVFTDGWLQEAIYIASPELYQEFQKWQEGSLTDKKEVNKLVLALFRYLLRMCARCTPYGLFAGCSLGEFGTTTQITLAHPDKHKKHCRLDMNYVAELVSMINAIPGIQEQLKYYPNSSLYKIANKYRYAEFTVNNKFRTYDLTVVEHSEYLDKIFEGAARGATITDLANSIICGEVNGEEAKEFVTELIQHQLLVSELEPTVTGEEFFTILLNKLYALKNTTGITEKLSHIHQILQSQLTGIHKYLQSYSLVKELLPATNSKDLVQTDLFLSTTHNTISATVMKDIQQHINKLWALVRVNGNGDLQNFEKAFSERYEQQEVPLVLALDAEAGIGYAGFTGSHADNTPLVDNIFINNASASHTIFWDKMQEFQLKRLHSCLVENKVEIELTNADLDELKQAEAHAIPDSLYLMGSIIGKNAKEVDEGDFQLDLKASSGPSAGSLLGRFCHGDASLMEKVKACLQDEEQNNPDCIYAEVVHLPEARTGNVLLRPQLRDHEIVYLGNGSVPQDNQILLTDLMVSVHSNTIILRSKKLNKRIIPRLSTAHNFSAGSLPVYKFLCDLQYQRQRSTLAWSWNSVKDVAFLPRVRYGKIILSKCAWILNKKDYPELTKDKKENAPINYLDFSRKIRKQFRLPQYVVIVEGDNELLINLENESCVSILTDTLIKKERVVLQEFLSKDKCFIEGEGGVYTNEIIVPLYRTDGMMQPPASQIRPEKLSEREKRKLTLGQGLDCKRSFITGSEWLYVKIYCGSNSAERLLKEIIKPLTQGLLADDKIDKWFFIRYADPEPHIRIRFHHATDKTFWQVVLERLHALIKDNVDNGLVHKIQTDTYEREIERYGAETIAMIEDIFYYDSEAVVDCIDLFEGEEGEKYRWLLALRGVDMLLNDFGFQLESKAALLKKMNQSFFLEFKGTKELSNQLNDKYRLHMREIGSFMDYRKDVENEIEEAVSVFALRSLLLSGTVKNISQLQTSNEATFNFEKFMPHFIHMFLNRMLLSNQRKHELVLYHFLSKYYESQIAISKQQLQNV